MSQGMSRSFEELVAEAESASVDGWDFSWLDGRATEQRPSWGYQNLMGERLGRAGAALDIQTGGGEVLAAAPTLPPVMAATESWPPNVIKATSLLRPRGVVVVADPDEPPLPFADSAFDLVTSRHPATVWWAEIARVLEPGERTSLNMWVTPACSNSSSTFSVLSRRLVADGITRTKVPTRLPLGSPLSIFVSSVCAWNSSTSAPSSTSYAR